MIDWSWATSTPFRQSITVPVCHRTHHSLLFSLGSIVIKNILVILFYLHIAGFTPSLYWLELLGI